MTYAEEDQGGGRPWKWSGVALAAGLVVVLLLTLSPSGGSTSGAAPILCLICGSRGTADLLANVILFVPIGAALAGTGAGARKALLFGSGVSILIEAAQMTLVVGRDANVMDVVTNTAGTGVGFVAAGAVYAGIRKRDVVGPRIATGMASVVLALVGLTGWLLRPVFPHTSYYAQFTASPDPYAPYLGEVLGARMGVIDLSAGRLADPEAVRSGLAAGDTIRLQVLKGPPTARVSKLFGIYTGEQQEILLLGVAQEDLIVQEYTRARNLKFDQAPIRLERALSGPHPGDTLSLSIDRDQGRICVLVDRRAFCPAGYTAGSGWMFLHASEDWGAWQQRMLAAAWIFAVTMFTSFWAPPAKAGSAYFLLLFALFGLPLGVGLLPLSMIEILAGVAGVTTGLILGPRAQARLRAGRV